jgi:chromosome partitioning protein
MGRILAVANQKGGVGKTTTAINLSAALALADRSVLLVDLDPQGNATTGLGLSRSNGRASIYRVLIEGVAVGEAVRPTGVPGLSVVPSEIDLVGAEIELVTMEGREGRLRAALGPVREAFEYLVLDCPPSLGLLTVNALTAADSVLIPLQCEYYAMEGLAQLLQTIALVRDRLNPGLRVEGVVLTMFDARTSLAAQVRAEVERHLGDQVLGAVIPRNVRLSEAPSHGRPALFHDLRSPGSIAYLELAKEVLAHG